MSTESEAASLFINSILAIVAVISTVFAYKTIRTSRQTAEAQLLNDLLGQFSSLDMLKSIRTLFDFQKDNPDVAEAYVKKYKPGNDLDIARRHVSHYYQNMARLREADYVTELFVKTLCTEQTPKLLREIVIPIEKAHAKIYDQTFNEEHLNFLLTLVDDKKTEQFYPAMKSAS